MTEEFCLLESDHWVRAFAPPRVFARLSRLVEDIRQFVRAIGVIDKSADAAPPSELDEEVRFETPEQKLEYLFIHYRQTVFYAANRILRDEFLAEDVVSESFIRAYSHLDKIDLNARHKTRRFFVVIAENLALDLYRQNKHVKLLPFEDEWMPSVETLYAVEEKSEPPRCSINCRPHTPAFCA